MIVVNDFGHIGINEGGAGGFGLNEDAKRKWKIEIYKA